MTTTLTPGTAYAFLNGNGEIAISEFFQSDLDAGVEVSTTYIAQDGSIAHPGSIPAGAANHIYASLYDDGSVKQFEVHTADGGDVVLTFKPTDQRPYGIGLSHLIGPADTADIDFGNGIKIHEEISAQDLTGYLLQSPNVKLTAVYDPGTDKTTLSLINLDHSEGAPSIIVVDGNVNPVLQQDASVLVTQLEHGDGSGVISHNGSAVIAAGGGNIIAAGGGNIIAAGGGNLIAAGGGNVISHNSSALHGFSGFNFAEDALDPGNVATLSSVTGAAKDALALVLDTFANISNRSAALLSTDDAGNLQTPAPDVYASDGTTTGVLSVGSHIQGSIETQGDLDWFKIDLVAGHHYFFDLKGAATNDGSLADPYIRIFDGPDRILADQVGANDDGGFLKNARDTFTAQMTGTYYIEAGSLGGQLFVGDSTDGRDLGGTGSYYLTAADATEAVILPNDTGTSPGDRITKDASISGSGLISTAVDITIDGGTTITNAVTSDDKGNWTYTPTGLSDGSHTIVATQDGVSGSVTFTLDTTPPTVTEVLASSQSSAAGQFSQTAALGGKAGANGVINFTVDGNAVGDTAMVNGAGDWAHTLTLADGQHTIVASETDTAGNTGSASFTFTVDTTAPTLQSLVATDAKNTSAQTVYYTVTFSDPVTGVDASDFQLVTSGVTGASITGVSAVDGTNGAAYTVTVDTGTGNGTVALDLKNGASIQDIAGNNLHLDAGSGVFLTHTEADTANNPETLAMADLNGDGNLDIVSTNVNAGNVSVLLGNGDGTFQTHVDYTVSSPITAIGDVTGDDIPDLIVADSFAESVSVLSGQGDGTFVPESNYSAGFTKVVAIADVDGDGKNDVLVGNEAGQADGTVSVLLGNGTSTNVLQSQITYALGVDPTHMVTADLDGDHDLDLIVTGSPGSINSSGVSVLLNNGHGVFGEAADVDAGLKPVGLATADFNGDGKLDLVVANQESSHVSVLLGNGDGTFGAATSVSFGHSNQDSPSEVAVADLNGDSLADIIVTNNGHGDVEVLFGNGDGTFKSPLVLAVAPNSFPVGLIVGDLNNAGGPDIVATNPDGNTVSVLMNTPGPVVGPTYTVSHGVVDTTPPTVTEHIANSGTFGPGQQIAFSFEMSEPVTITGTPTVTFTNGGVATYDAIDSDSQNLVFHYTPQNASENGSLKIDTVDFVAKDAAGNAADFSAFHNSSMSIVIDTIAPTVTAKLLHDTGTSAIDGISNDITLSGTGENNATVHFNVDGNAITDVTTANSAGAWTFSQLGITTDGLHTVIASETDSVGNVGTTTITFTRDTAGPQITGNVSQNGGPYGPNHPLTLSFDVGEAITVTGAPSLTLSNGGKATYSAADSDLATGHLAFKYTPGAGQDTSDLTITGATFAANSIKDVAGNDGSATIVGQIVGTDLTADVDTLKPSAVASLTSNTGFSATDKITNNPAIHGTSDPLVAIVVKEGNTVIGNATADGSGAWSFTPSGLADGAHTFTVTATDPAGNVGTSSVAFTLDTHEALINSAVSSAATVKSGDTITLTLTFNENVHVNLANPVGLQVGDHGTATYVSGDGGKVLKYSYTPIAANEVNSDLQITGTVGVFTDDAGNAISAPTKDIVFGANGNVTVTMVPAATAHVTNVPTAFKAADVVHIELDFNEVVNVATGAGAPSLKLSDGGIAVYAGGTGTQTLTFDYTVGAKDTAAPLKIASVVNPGSITDGASHGANLANLSNASLGVTIDNTAPTITAALTNNTGVSKTDALTSDATISGKTEAGATVTVKDGATTLGTATADSTGAWTYTPSGLTDGAHSLTATATDVAGNVGVASKPVALTLDTTIAHIASFTQITGATTNAASVVYDLKFDEAVSGVVASDFVLTQNGLTGAKISGVKAISSSEYQVTVATGTGNGELSVDYHTLHAQDIAGNGVQGGHLQDSTSVASLSYNVAVAAGDINVDGKVDLVSLSGYSTSAISLGNGNGTFHSQADFNLGTQTSMATMADLNGDGRADLIATNNNGNGVAVGLGQADGTLTISYLHQDGTGAPHAVAVGDLNADGKLDIIESDGGNVAVFFNNANGTFANTNVIGAAADSIAIGDFDGDGNGDIVFTTGGSATVSLMLGDGSGNFAAPSTTSVGSIPAEVVTADLNGDHNLDLVLANSGNGTVSVLLGNGDGTFQSGVDYATDDGANHVVVADFNQDGYLDLAVSNAGAQDIAVLFGAGDGTFGDATLYNVGGAGRLTTGDFNNDGRIDIAVATGSQSVILLNEAFAGGEGFTIDKTAPVVTSVSSPTAANTHVGLGGGPIEIDLQLSEDVVINGPLSGLTLKLSDGGVATYDSIHSADDKLAFSYIPDVKQNTTDLTVTGLVAAKGTTVADAAGNALNIKGAAGQHLGIVVDTTAPTVSKVAVLPTSGAQVDGNTIAFTLTTSEHVNADADTKLLLSNGGTAALAGAATDTGTLTFSYTVAGGGTTDLKVIGIDQSQGGITDLAGNAASSTLTFDTKLPVNVFTWKGGTGNYSDANWNPQSAPGEGATALLTAKGPYTVTISDLTHAASTASSLTTVAGVTLEIAGSHTTFDITNSTTNVGTIVIDNDQVLALAGAVANSGNINIGHANANETAHLALSGDTTLTGKGHITLSGTSSGSAFSSFDGATHVTLTNVDNTIAANAGSLGNGNFATILNQKAGTIDATGTVNLFGEHIENAGMMEATEGSLLTIFSAVDSNSGTIQASGASSHVLLQEAVTNTKTGIILATGTGAHVDLGSYTYTGGTLKTASGGLIEVQASHFATLDGAGVGNPVNIAGTVEIEHAATLALKGVINNTGAIRVVSDDHGSIALIGDVTLNGTGQIVLTDDANNGIGSSSAVTLTNVSNTISGAGSFGSGFMTLINQAKGTINGTGASNELTIEAASIDNSGILEGTSSQGLVIYSNVANSNLMQALGGDSRLDLHNGTITQTAKGVLQASGSDAQVYLSNEIISGGTLKTSTGAINVLASSTLDGRNGHGVTVAGQMNVAIGAELRVEGSIVNNGTITLHGNSTNATTLTVIAATTLSGTGHINFDGADETHTGLSISGTLDNVSNTISGTGFIVSGTLHNGAKGVIGALDGDMLSISGETLNNDGKLEAAGSGHLDLSSDHIVNGTAGSIFTTAGAEIDVTNTDITGGAINIVKNSSFDDDLGTIDHAKITNAGIFTGDGLDITNSTVTNSVGGVFGADGGNLVVHGALANTGTLTATEGTLDITGAVTGKGTAIIHDDGVLQFDGASSAAVTFFAGEDGTLSLSAATTSASKFTGSVTGFDVGDHLLLGAINYGAGDSQASFTANAAHTGGVLTVTDSASHSLTLTFVGDYTGDTFQVTDDGHTHVAIQLLV